MKTTAVARPAFQDPGTPIDLNDMVRRYQGFIHHKVGRLNRVGHASNLEDIIQHVFLELCRVNVVEKYNQSSAGLPEKVPAKTAAAYCGMTFDSWKQAAKTAVIGNLPKPFKGFTKAQRFAIFERDHGTCAKCGHEMGNFALRLRVLQESDPGEYARIRASLHEKHGIEKTVWVFWGIERVNRRKYRSKDILDGLATICLPCLYAKKTDGGVDLRKKGGTAPSPVEGGYSSKEALYDRAAVERYRKDREDRGIPRNPHAIVLDLPKRTPFFAYLSRSIVNIYKNWCRTRSRRYQEIGLAPMEDGTAWDAQVEDTTRIEPESLIDINRQINDEVDTFVRAVSTRRGKKVPQVDPDNFVRLISEGRSVAEAARELQMPRAIVVRARSG